MHHFTGTQDIIGYLAVDTMKIKAFRPEYDFDIGALLADALYIFLDRVYPAQPATNAEGKAE